MQKVGIGRFKVLVDLNIKIKELLITLHNDVFQKLNEDAIDVFLCGGISTREQLSIRDQIRNQFHGSKNVRIMYPEDLFIEILNRDKNSNLLILEKFLADNCQIICIICESPGSLVELGAFTNNANTQKKVIAVVEEKRRRNKSFIMLGPIKLLSKKDKYNVVFYDKNDINKLVKKLKSSFSHKGKSIKGSIDTMVGLYHFIPLVLYFFTEIETHQLAEYIKYLYKQFGMDERNFSILFMSSLRMLYKAKLIQKGDMVYKLTAEGYNSTGLFLSHVKLKNKTKLYDSIRFGIINEKYHRFP